MKFYAMKSLCGKQIVSDDVAPWDFKPTKSSADFPSSDDFKLWWNKPEADHFFYSCTEAINPNCRCSMDNPPVRLHGIIADYDFRDLLEPVIEYYFNKFTGIRPNAISRTTSGGVRAIWIFERALTVFEDNKVYTKKLLEKINKVIGIKDLVPGLDVAAYNRLEQFYEVGHSWVVSDLQPLSTSVLESIEDSVGKITIPRSVSLDFTIEEIAQEVEKQYPGRWSGPFEIGARGVRFWDSYADNATSAKVCTHGMMCYTGDKPFKPWPEILDLPQSRTLVQVEQKVSKGLSVPARGKIFYDGSHYWKFNTNINCWVHDREKAIENLLETQGVSNITNREDHTSALKLEMTKLRENNRITQVMPFVFDPEGIMKFQGHTCLNTYTGNYIEPDRENKTAWGEGFPKLAQFLEAFLIREYELKLFIAWLAYFYRAVVLRQHTQGQAVFLLGSTGIGKSLLGSFITDLVGRSANPSTFFKGGRFNKGIMGSPFLIMDDSMQDCNNNKEHKDYSSAVKNMVSNRVFTMEAKGKDTEQVAWNGRILGCFNDDSSSISAMPNLTTSFQDKVIVLKPEGNKDLFKDGNAELMRKELPAFATYLFHHEIPIEIRDDRFGTVAYINTAILEKLRMTTSRDGLEETLKAFLLTLYASGHGDLQDGYYSTSVNKLYSNMTTDFGMKSQMGHASLPTFYRFMGKVKDDRVQFPWAENPTRSIWKFDCRYLHDLYSPEEIKAMIHYDPEINPRNL